MDSDWISEWDSKFKEITKSLDRLEVTCNKKNESLRDIAEEYDGDLFRETRNDQLTWKGNIASDLLWARPEFPLGSTGIDRAYQIANVFGENAEKINDMRINYDRKNTRLRNFLDKEEEVRHDFSKDLMKKMRDLDLWIRKLKRDRLNDEAYENVLRLVEEEQEDALNEKQKLEMEIQDLKGRRHLGDDEAEELEKVDIKGMEETLDVQESLIQNLTIKERQSNDELQEARKSLIEVLVSCCKLPQL